MNREFEVISSEKLRHVKIFVNDITYRNYHLHNAFEFLIMLEGHGHINLADESISMAPGRMALINPNESHEIDAHGGHMIILIAQVSRHFCREYLTDLSTARFQQRDLTAALADHPETLVMLKNRFYQAAESYLREPPFFAYDCLSCMTALFHRLLLSVPSDHLSDRDRSAIRKRIVRISLILDYVDQHYTSPIRLKDLAELEGLTSTYISHFFSEQIGISFQEYLNNLRFERAVSLLPNRALTLEEIAYNSGFSDPKYLNQMIWKRMGCSAKDYREKLDAQWALLPKRDVQLSLERKLSADEALSIICPTDNWRTE